MEQPFLDLSRPARGVLRLDGQLERPAGGADVVGQFEEPFQGEYGRELARHGVPVGGLLVVLPGTEVEGGEVGQFQGGDGAAAVGRAVHPAVVHTDELSVRGEADIALQGVRTVLDGLPVRGQGVLGGVVRGPAVRDDLDGRLW